MGAILSPESRRVQLRSESILTQLFCHRAFWIFLIGLGLISVIFKRRLRELKELSYVFLGMMICFLLLLLAQLFITQKPIEVTIKDIGEVRFDHKLVTSISIVIFIYNVQFIVFEAFHELKNRSNERFARASATSHAIETVFFISTAFLGILLLGPKQIKANFLLNIAYFPGAVSIGMRMFFCFVIIVGIPFIFMANKEQGLVIHDELENRSLSNQAERTIDSNNSAKDRASEHGDEEEVV